MLRTIGYGFPIHRHKDTNEVVVVMRGKGYEAMYDDEGHELERVMMEAGSACSGVMVPRGAWHTFVALEDGTTIFDAKDGAYDPVEMEDIKYLTSSVLFIIPCSYTLYSLATHQGQTLWGSKCVHFGICLA